MNGPLTRNDQPEVGEEGVLGGHTSWWYRTPSSLMEGWVSPSMHQPLTPGILGWGPEQMCTSATRTGLEDKGCTKSENCSTCPQSLSASRRQQEAKMSHIQPNKCQRLKSSTPIHPTLQEVKGPMASFLSCILREASPPPSRARQAEASGRPRNGGNSQMGCD